MMVGAHVPTKIGPLEARTVNRSRVCPAARKLNRFAILRNGHDLGHRFAGRIEIGAFDPLAIARSADPRVYFIWPPLYDVIISGFQQVQTLGSPAFVRLLLEPLAIHCPDDGAPDIFGGKESLFSQRSTRPPCPRCPRSHATNFTGMPTQKKA
jgi:hypothetical protein